MKRRRFVSIALAVLILTAAEHAPASVTLQSAELTHGRGFFSAPLFGGPISSQDTTYDPPFPFPNDARNFAVVGPEGLSVRVNRLAQYSHHRGNTYVDDWTAERFLVRFELDQPATYTYERSLSGGDDPGADVLLDGSRMPLFGMTSGILPAGQHTLYGSMEYRWNGVINAPDFFHFGGFSDVRFTVAPEPSALLAATGGLLLVVRRRRA
jgi:hypothetical protein